MKKIDINALIQLLGMVGIIVSLIFVGLEMRQSQNIALAAQQQSRTEIFTNLVQSLNESSEVSLYQIFMKNEQNKTLTSSEKKIAENYAFQAVWVFENDFIQLQSGLISDDVWEAKLRAINTVASRCAYRDSLEYLMRFVTPELLNLVHIRPKSECISYQ